MVSLSCLLHLLAAWMQPELDLPLSCPSHPSPRCPPSPCSQQLLWQALRLPSAPAVQQNRRLRESSGLPLRVASSSQPLLALPLPASQELCWSLLRHCSPRLPRLWLSSQQLKMMCRCPLQSPSLREHL